MKRRNSIKTQKCNSITTKPIHIHRVGERERWMDWKPVRLVCQPIRLCSIALEHWIRFRIEIARENNNYFHFIIIIGACGAQYRIILFPKTRIYICARHTLTHIHIHSLSQSNSNETTTVTIRRTKKKSLRPKWREKNTNERTTTQEHIAYTLWIDALIGSATIKRNGIFAN